MKTKNLIFFISSILLFTYCKKDDDHDHNTTGSINLNWSFPADGSTIRFQDTLRITALASFSSELHGYEVVVAKASDTLTPLFFADVHKHASTLQIAEKWRNNQSDSTKLLLKVTVAKSHDGDGNEYFRRTIWAVK